MVSFIGYVNALVVENTLLQKLPNAVFSQRIILEENEKTISLIAAEGSDYRKRREQDEQDIKTLSEVLGVLKKYAH